MSESPEIRPAAFTFDDRGAVINVEIDGKPVSVLITGKDKLRLSDPARRCGAR